MIVSVGTDIVKVKRIKEVLFRRPERFKKKILSKEELQKKNKVPQSILHSVVVIKQSVQKHCTDISRNDIR